MLVVYKEQHNAHKTHIGDIQRHSGICIEKVGMVFLSYFKANQDWI